jgi:hypothetical protein
LIFGTAAIWIFYRLARFLFGPRIALYSTILFAFFPLACHYSQEARPYSLLLLLSLLCYERLLSDPCGSFRPAASKDPVWQKQGFKGFVLFLRSK